MKKMNATAYGKQRGWCHPFFRVTSFVCCCDFCCFWTPLKITLHTRHPLWISSRCHVCGWRPVCDGLQAPVPPPVSPALPPSPSPSPSTVQINSKHCGLFPREDLISFRWEFVFHCYNLHDVIFFYTELYITYYSKYTIFLFVFWSFFFLEIFLTLLKTKIKCLFLILRFCATCSVTLEKIQKQLYTTLQLTVYSTSCKVTDKGFHLLWISKGLLFWGYRRWECMILQTLAKPQPVSWKWRFVNYHNTSNTGCIRYLGENHKHNSHSSYTYQSDINLIAHLGRKHTHTHT